MGEGLRRVARRHGGLKVTAGGKTVHYKTVPCDCGLQARVEMLERALRLFVNAHDSYCRALAPAKARGMEFDDPLSDAVEVARAALDYRPKGRE